LSWGDKAKDRAPSKVPSASDSLASAKVEASWNLGLADARAPSGEESKARLDALEAAVVRTRGLVGQYATRLEDEHKTDLDWGRVIEVPANRIDDFYAGLLKASGDVSVPSEVQESLKQLHSEQDRLVLKSGFVLVGRVRRKGREYVVKTGSVTHRVPVSDVTKVEKADQVRRIRVLIR
tara:strand:- start:102 stop:638 length:537 start_codon:yes stop_codon:yes gene_type:complete